MLITGGAGCIGAALVARLVAQGTAVKALKRGIDWEVPRDATDPGRAEVSDFSGRHAVVHLAGEPIAQGRWTREKMTRIRVSRVEGTRLVARVCARATNRPKVLVVASGTGYYGSRGDEEMTEASGVGSGFLAEVARDWEAAAQPAREAGIRVVFLRMGAVLSMRGGLLRNAWPFARAGLLCRVAGPPRWVGWIGMDDLLGVVETCLAREEIVGPLNAVAPAPATLNELVNAIAAAADRPVLMAVPTWVVRAGMGHKAEAVLESCRAVPEKLRRLGFRFTHSRVEEAIAAEVGMSKTTRVDKRRD